MKIHSRFVLAGALCLAFVSAFAQPAPRMGGAGGPRGIILTGHMAKLFGTNSAFSATLDMQSSGLSDTVSGKLFADAGKTRFEVDMTQVMSKMPPQVLAQIRTMGMDKTVIIALPDQKATYTVYPGMKAYVQSALAEADAATAESDFKMEATELGKESVDGHPCVKNKVVVTGPEGTNYESTVWNAEDLKQFPIKIEHIERGMPVTLLFKDLQLTKPDADLFTPPAAYAKYDDMRALMQATTMRSMTNGGMGGLPPGHPPITHPPVGQ